MLFCIDIGNTHTVLCLASGSEIVHHWRLRTDKEITSDELLITVNALFEVSGVTTDYVDGVIVSSVVPQLNRRWEDLIMVYLGMRPLFVSSSMDLGIKISYEDPAAVGPDRLVNVVGAYVKYHRAMVVVDFGTATTFDYVSGIGEYMGGAIAPGAGISLKALHSRTSMLPRVEMTTPPDSVIAQDTVSSMTAGIMYGYAGLVDGIVGRMKKEMSKENPMVIATGGLAHLFADITKTIDTVDKFLTIHGLVAIFERVQSL